MMKLATKISAGYAILIGLMIAVLVYQASVIYSVQSINRKLSQVKFRAANLSYQLRHDLDLIEEFTRKFFVAKDEEFHQQMKAMRSLFAEDLQRIRTLGLSEKEVQQIERLSEIWQEYKQAESLQEQASAKQPSGEINELLSLHLDYLRSLRDQTEKVMLATQNSIAESVRQATRSGQQADWVSVGASAAALGLSIVVCVLIVQSISRQLDRLTQGTREVAKGHFGYRLDSSGNDEFSEVVADFNIMARRLNELDQMKRDFVSHVSHELKTPLGSIQETIRLLLEEIPGPLEEKQKRLLQLNLQSSERLSSMIRNLLDLSRIEAGVMEYQFKEHDLVTLAQSTLSEFEPQLREKHVHIQAHFPKEPVRVKCDEIRIRQLIENLLGNALKFSPQGGTIRVQIQLMDGIPEKVPPMTRRWLSVGANGFALLIVSDCGPGVPHVHKQKIFDKFHQIRKGKKMAGQGVGLGLSICRSIVETHRGAIWVEDRPGGGSVFSVLMRSEG